MLLSDLSNRDGQIEALKADIIRRAAENSSLSSQVSEQSAKLDALQSKLEETENSLNLLIRQTNLIKEWLLSAVFGSADSNNREKSPLENLNVLMRFRIRSQDNPKVLSIPGTQGSIIGYAAASCDYEVLDVYPGLWLEIRLDNGVTGWISSTMGTVQTLEFLIRQQDTVPDTQAAK